MVELSLEPRAIKFALGTTLLSGLVALRWLLSKQARFRSVPGVWFFGVLPQLGPGAENAAEKFDEFAKDYGADGAFEMLLAGTRMVCLTSWPETSKILEMRPFKAVKPGSLIHSAEGMMEGVFFSEGERWKRERRLISPAFNAKSMASYVPAITTMTKTLLKSLRHDMETNGSVNFTELMPLYTADVLCATAFGKDLGMLETRNTGLVQDVKNMLGALGVRAFVQIPYWKIPLLGRYIDGGNIATEKIGRTVQALMNEQAGQGATVVEKLRQMHGEKLTQKEVVGNLIVLFGAGTDTTSVALSWAFYHLARDQALQQRVAEEVKDLPEEVSMQHLDSLLQVSALWLEILRFNGPAPFEMLDIRETVEIMGRKVRPGTEILLCYRHMLKTAPEVKAKLGDDLEVFRPARWIASEGILKCPPFDSLAFGHGARICLGKQLADYEGRLVIAQVLRHFVVEQWQGPPLKEKTAFVVLPAEDVKVSLKPRLAKSA